MAVNVFQIIKVVKIKVKQKYNRNKKKRTMVKVGGKVFTANLFQNFGA